MLDGLAGFQDPSQSAFQGGHSPLGSTHQQHLQRHTGNNQRSPQQPRQLSGSFQATSIKQLRIQAATGQRPPQQPRQLQAASGSFRQLQAAPPEVPPPQKPGSSPCRG